MACLEMPSSWAASFWFKPDRTSDVASRPSRVRFESTCPISAKAAEILNAAGLSRLTPAIRTFTVPIRAVGRKASVASFLACSMLASSSSLAVPSALGTTPMPIAQSPAANRAITTSQVVMGDVINARISSTPMSSNSPAPSRVDKASAKRLTNSARLVSRPRYLACSAHICGYPLCVLKIVVHESVRKKRNDDLSKNTSYCLFSRLDWHLLIKINAENAQNCQKDSKSQGQCISLTSKCIS